MVDAVITWVDGENPVHAAKRASYIEETSDPKTEVSASKNTRFASMGEIEYCIKLIRKNAPWINQIFLITDAQCPDWLDREERDRLKVTLVDHRVIFSGYEEALPTFNSLSIETVLHRIPSLSDRFLYFNDDVFLIKPTRVSDFFDGDTPKLRGRLVFRFKKLRRFVSKVVRQPPFPRGMVGIRLGRSRKLPLSTRWLVMMGHAPHPVKTEDFARIMESKNRIRDNIKYRFRTVGQFFPINLYATLARSSGSVKIIGPDGIYLAPGLNQDVCAVLADARSQSNDEKHLCVQSLDEFDPQSQRAILEFLDSVLEPT